MSIEISSEKNMVWGFSAEIFDLIIEIYDLINWWLIYSVSEWIINHVPLQVKNQGLYLQGSRAAQKFKNHGFKLKTMVSNSDGVPFD